MSIIRTQTFVTKMAYDIDMILGEEPDFFDTRKCLKIKFHIGKAKRA